MLTWWLWVVYVVVAYRGTLVSTRNLGNTLQVVHEWKYFDFDFGSEAKRQAAIKSGEYNYTKSAPIDVDRWRDKTFVTILRDDGVPSTLNVITDKQSDSGPLLKPYPDWSWAKVGNCSGIVSVYRVAIDKCDRLWVLDTGYIGNTPTCPAKLFVFDLNTSKLLEQITIPNNIARNATLKDGLLVTPIVQTFGSKCEDTHVYIADVQGYALIVYDGKSFRRLTSSAFDFDPRYTKYTIENQSFDLNDGILGMALSPRTQQLYFSPMSSHNLASVDTKQLLLSGNHNVQYRVGTDVLWTQASAKAASITGAIFFGLVSDTAIGCWNEFRPLNRKNIDVVAKNSTTMQFTSGLKIKSYGAKEVLWALTDRYQKLATGTTNFSEVNFRILKGNVRDLVKDTCCQPRGGPVIL